MRRGERERETKTKRIEMKRGKKERKTMYSALLEIKDEGILHNSKCLKRACALSHWWGK
jgi:hypothetical protein